ncbi:MAG: SDR family oxidoreductase [Chitinophagaceae bacterium]|nr:SDR family oxidoreductase [Chitinophagaceae bacterium]
MHMLAVITGATKGIGRAVAEQFVREGFHIAFCARTESEVKATAAHLQALNAEACILAEVADLSLHEDVMRFAQAVLQTFSSVDVLVNNAGIYRPGSVCNEPDENMDYLMRLNFLSAYHLTRALLPRMQAAGKGHIFTMCSVAGLKAYPGGGSYSISKFALEGFTQNLRLELMTQGIKVTAVQAGATMSDSWAGANIPAERMMRADDVASAIWSAYNLSPQSVVESILLRPQLGDL